MDYDKLLNLGVELGRRLMDSGAEIYRVEESVGRLLRAYGLEDLTVSLCGVREGYLQDRVLKGASR